MIYFAFQISWQEDESDERSNHNSGMESKVSCAKVSTVDTGWAWMVMFACYYAHILMAGLIFTFGIFTVALVEDLKVYRAQVALLGALPPSIMLLTGRDIVSTNC